MKITNHLLSAKYYMQTKLDDIILAKTSRKSKRNFTLERVSKLHLEILQQHLSEIAS